ncbi:hypothetical protein D3C77_649790 [compost metagenome]
MQRIGDRKPIGHRLTLRLRHIQSLHLRRAQALPAHRRTVFLMEAGSEQIRRARGKLTRLWWQFRLAIGAYGIEIEHRRRFLNEDVRVHPARIRHEKAAAQERQQRNDRQRGRPAAVFQ